MSARRAESAALVFALSLGAAACGGEPPAPWEEGRPPAGERTFRGAAWDTLFTFGGALQDTLLLAPSRIAADKGGAYVADLLAGRLLRIDRAGRVAWSWGRRGRGPEEMAHPRHLALDANGTAWLLDVENARLVGIDREGRRLGTVPVEEVGARADVFVPRHDGTFVLLALDPDRPLVLLAPDGRVLERRPFPIPAFRTLPPLATQLVAANDPDADAWAVALSMADGFFPFEGTRWTGARGWYVEPVPTTRVRTERRRLADSEETTSRVVAPHFGAAGLAVSGDRLLVLFQGASELANRVVDVYRRSTGEYVESLILPEPVLRFAHADSVYYGVVENPYPAVVAWRPRPASIAPSRSPIR